MHFFGSLGSLSFLMGFAITVWLIWEKLSNLRNQIKARDITEQPLFFLALVAIVAGIQLFLAGFLGEILANQTKKEDYLIPESLDS